MIDIDAKQFGPQSGEVLSCAIGVGVGTAVAGGHIEHSVWGERHVAAVVAFGIPLNDDFGGIVMKCVGRFAVNHIPGDPRHLIGYAGLPDRGVCDAGPARTVTADVDVTVLGKRGMEHD